MPLPKETLDEIAKSIKTGEERIKSIEDVVTDLRKAGIDASKPEEDLRVARESNRQLRIFFDCQMKRVG